MRFDNIDMTVVISLPDSGRRGIVKKELQNNEIDFSFYDGIRNKEDGAEGLKATFKKLFTMCVALNVKSILVFEDDVNFVVDNPSYEMNLAIQDLPEDFHLCKFGANLLFPVSKVTSSLNRITASYALHAVLYSLDGMRKVLKHIDHPEPIDVIIQRHIESLGHCYVSSKMIANQRPTKSDIFVFDPARHSNFAFYEKESGLIRWDKLMEQQWGNNTKHLAHA